MEERRYALYLRGYPRLVDPTGAILDVSSRKALALLALLATGSRGTRSRAYLQQKLWGSRAARQAQSSLRREIASLRKAAPGLPLSSTYRTVALELSQISIDIYDPSMSQGSIADFLEGLDLPGEEDFEDWLREVRNSFAEGVVFQQSRTPPSAAQAEIPVTPTVGIILPPAKVPKSHQDYEFQLMQRDVIYRMSVGNRLRPVVIPKAKTLDDNHSYLAFIDLHNFAEEEEEISISIFSGRGIGKARQGVMVGKRRCKLSVRSYSRQEQIAAEHLVVNVLALLQQDIVERARYSEVDSDGQKLWKARSIIEEGDVDNWDEARELLLSMSSLDQSLEAYGELYRIAMLEIIIQGETQSNLEELAMKIDDLTFHRGVDVVAMSYRGFGLLLLGDHNAAANIHGRLDQIAPLNHWVCMLGALIELSSGRWGQAMDDCCNIFRGMHADAYTAPFIAFHALLEFYRGEYEAATDAARSALTVGKRAGIAALVFNLAQRRTGSKEKAVGSSELLNGEDLKRFSSILKLIFAISPSLGETLQGELGGAAYLQDRERAQPDSGYPVRHRMK